MMSSANLSEFRAEKDPIDKMKLTILSQIDDEEPRWNRPGVQKRRSGKEYPFYQCAQVKRQPRTAGQIPILMSLERPADPGV
ncbi:hypothetical protein Tco_1476898 [Tanacetum coccineum]